MYVCVCIIFTYIWSFCKGQLLFVLATSLPSWREGSVQEGVLNEINGKDNEQL